MLMGREDGGAAPLVEGGEICMSLMPATCEFYKLRNEHPGSRGPLFFPRLIKIAV